MFLDITDVKFSGDETIFAVEVSTKPTLYDLGANELICQSDQAHMRTVWCVALRDRVDSRVGIGVN